MPPRSQDWWAPWSRLRVLDLAPRRTPEITPVVCRRARDVLLLELGGVLLGHQDRWTVELTMLLRLLRRLERTDGCVVCKRGRDAAAPVGIGEARGQQVALDDKVCRLRVSVVRDDRQLPAL